MASDQSRTAVGADTPEHRGRRERSYAEGDMDGTATTSQSQVVQKEESGLGRMLSSVRCRICICLQAVLGLTSHADYGPKIV